jgi:preprotein translocase subunit SecE
MFARLKSYIQDSYREFHRVNWPTKKETVRLVLVVIGLSLGVAVFLGVLDMVFVYLLEKFVID